MRAREESLSTYRHPHAYVSRVQPAVAVDRLGRLHGVLQVALEHVQPLDAHLRHTRTAHSQAEESGKQRIVIHGSKQSKDELAHIEFPENFSGGTENILTLWPTDFF